MNIEHCHVLEILLQRQGTLPLVWRFDLFTIQWEKALEKSNLRTHNFCNVGGFDLYLGLSPVDKYIDDFVAIISNRKGDILGKDSGTTGKQVISVESDYDEEMSFTMISEAASTVQLTDESQANQEEQLQKLVDERMKEI
ncbi:hypothetical protein G4B88_004791, partial [Cannabis sativa]